MKTPDEKTKVPHDLLAEAAIWVARLHGPGRTKELEAGFRRWLSASRSHDRAFELVSDVWEEARNLRQVAYRRNTRADFSWKSSWRMISAATTAAILLASLVLFLHSPDLITAVGEQRLLTLDDGSRVFMNTNTRLAVRYDDQVRRIELRAGEALFDVAKRAGWPFVVLAGDRQVAALGTSFVVRHELNRTAVTLVEGKVAVLPVESSATKPLTELLRPAAPQPAVANGGSAENSAASEHKVAPLSTEKASGTNGTVGEVLIMNPGERLTFVGDGPPKVDEPTLDKVMAWRRGQVILDDTSLAQAVDEMNRYSAIKLVVEAPGAASLVINGLFQTGDSESFANAVAQTYGLQVVNEGRRIVIAGRAR